MTHKISSKRLSLKDLNHISQNVTELQLSESSLHAVQACRDYLDKNFGSANSTPTYGINTGFGSLCHTSIDRSHLTQLQHNLIMSHACGTGEEVPEKIVKWMLFLKIQSLCYGHSGVSVAVVQRLIDFYNHGIYPVIYEQGSLGASGDLAPLAHLALPLIGLGEVVYKGKRYTGEQINNIKGWESLQLQSKEGLALINGTQFMLAYGVYLALESRKLWYWSHITAALSLDGFSCNMSPFDERIHFIRPHKGQLTSAALFRELLDDSEIAADEKLNVQDPYSFRCTPQVHGASKDALDYFIKTILTECNSVTDNPNVFPESDAIISGGNFHGQPLALALDFLSIAMSEIGSISERRIFQLMSGTRNLPPFLSRNAGLNSGMMILQYTAASIVSQNKHLANPSSTDSIVSSNGQEDHVSMGANAATKSFKIIDNIKTVLAIELLTSSQALEFHTKQTSSFLKSIISIVRSGIAPFENDRVMYTDIQLAKEIIASTELDMEVLH
ncbi:histidine ammonia-lyase [Nonlabens sp.]|uniref:histidine ammonia-lyase n=1 Tax=Nonlabens sp. TaxID=1888209 RepID=UPI001BCB1B31|nr:histidine ammonia-lyase [Nonlabens sp.]